MAAGPRARPDRRPSRFPRGARATADLSRRGGRGRPLAISARGWGARHPGRAAWALRGVDLAIAPGERILLLGASGSGKSTLLTALAGLLDPEAVETEGSLLVGGQSPRTVAPSTGVVFQDPESQIVMGRVGDDVAFGLENRCVPTGEIAPRVREALRAVGFPYPPDRSTDALSGGEQQLLALAGTLALEPGLLLLDEPTANLDRASADRLRQALARGLDERAATVVVVDHRIEGWLDMVDRIVVLGGAAGVTDDMSPADLRRRDPASLALSGVWSPGFAPPPPRPRGGPGGPLVVAAEASFRYPGAGVDAVGPLSITLRQGEAVAVTGETGSGKSTLALLVGGLLRPSAGSVVATPNLSAGRHDRVLAAWPARTLARRIGFVFQDPEHQFLAGSVRDELLLGPMRTGLDRREAGARADVLLDRLGLRGVAGANPFTLSGGEKRRLSVASAIATAPPVLVLDEPTFGQDPPGWTELLTLLRGLRDEGHALAFVTHDDAFAAALADRRVALARAV